MGNQEDLTPSVPLDRGKKDLKSPLLRGDLGGLERRTMLISKNKSHIPYDPRLKERARELRKNMTAAEKKLWLEYFRGHDLRFQRQKPIAHFIVDFYCSSAGLIIEIDGDGHYTEFGKGYDEERTSVLAKYGLRVIRFTNDDVMNRFDGVIKEIEKRLPTGEG